MTQTMLIISAALLCGAFISAALCLHIIFYCHNSQIDKAIGECHNMLGLLERNTIDFKKVTADASAANQSLGQAVQDFDLKLKELEDRVAMLRANPARTKY